MPFLCGREAFFHIFRRFQNVPALKQSETVDLESDLNSQIFKTASCERLLRFGYRHIYHRFQNVGGIVHPACRIY